MSDFDEILEPLPRPRPEEIVGLLIVAAVVVLLVWGFYV